MNPQKKLSKMSQFISIKKNLQFKLWEDLFFYMMNIKTMTNYNVITH